MNIICGCFTMLVNLNTSFSMFYQCAEALVCSDQNVVKQATFCSEFIYLKMVTFETH